MSSIKFKILELVERPGKMSSNRGCFKNGCFGCLGLLVLLIVFLAVSTLVAKKSLDSVKMEDRWLAATTASSENSKLVTESSKPGRLKGGRVILNLAQGEFEIKPAAPGEPLSVKAIYDSHNFHLEENYQVLPDSTWTYQLDYYRTQNGLQAIIQAILGEGGESRLVVYLPSDVPLDLVLRIEEGGMESEIGGLWINDADLFIGKGGFVVSVSEPLQKPMGKLKLHGRMGGLVVSKLGNASPNEVDLSWKMGGGDVDLRGPWRNDCEISLRASMGGMDVRVPEDVRTSGLPELDEPLSSQNQEIPMPVLKFNVNASMGGFEVHR